MKILLVEDNYLQGQWLTEELRRFFRTDPLWLKDESKFRAGLGEIEAMSPDVAVIDVMLKWADPDRDAPPVPAHPWDKHRAGLRCQEILAAGEKTKKIPIILYTVLSEADLRTKVPELPSDVSYLQKDSDPMPLIQRIQEVVRGG